VFDLDITDVPEHKLHWASRLSIGLLSSIPGVSTTINATGSMTIDADTLARNNETSMMILKGNGV
jgi:hypothetical protein